MRNKKNQNKQWIFFLIQKYIRKTERAFDHIAYIVSDLLQETSHCVKTGRIRSFSNLHFSAFGRNTEIYRVNLLFQSKHGKIKIRKTRSTANFYAVQLGVKWRFRLTVWDVFWTSFVSLVYVLCPGMGI